MDRGTSGGAVSKRPAAMANTGPVLSESLDAFETDDPASLGQDPSSTYEDDDSDIPDEPQYSETSYFWHPEGELETPLAVLWVNTKFPKSRALVVSELLIPRLNEQNRVYILSRPRARFAPLLKITRNANSGQQFHDPIDPMDRLDSVKCSQPIELKPFISGASRYSIGKFDSDKFFDVCAQFMSGSMRVQSKEMTIRYIPG